MNISNTTTQLEIPKDTQVKIKHTTYYEVGKGPEANKTHTNDYGVPSIITRTIGELFSTKKIITLEEFIKKIDKSIINRKTIAGAVKLSGSFDTILEIVDSRNNQFEPALVDQDMFADYFSNTVNTQSSRIGDSKFANPEKIFIKLT